jgi:hypothetical protein
MASTQKYVRMGANGAPPIFNELEEPPRQGRRRRPLLVVNFDAFSLPLDLVVLFTASLSADERKTFGVGCRHIIENSCTFIHMILHQKQNCIPAFFVDKRPTTNDSAWADTHISRFDDALGLQNHLRCKMPVGEENYESSRRNAAGAMSDIND